MAPSPWPHTNTPWLPIPYRANCFGFVTDPQTQPPSLPPTLPPTADPGCGGTYTDSEGIIISPNWPNNYAANRQCIYLVRLPPSEVVALNFTHMGLETHGSCMFDYLEVKSTIPGWGGWGRGLSTFTSRG